MTNTDIKTLRDLIGDFTPDEKGRTSLRDHPDGWMARQANIFDLFNFGGELQAAGVDPTRLGAFLAKFPPDSGPDAEATELYAVLLPADALEDTNLSPDLEVVRLNI